MKLEVSQLFFPLDPPIQMPAAAAPGHMDGEKVHACLWHRERLLLGGGTDGARIKIPGRRHMDRNVLDLKCMDT